jgi:hypothetical protein
MITKRLLVALVLSATSGCSVSLPGDYSVSRGDRGKAWLQNPDGTLTHGGVIKDLYRDERHILLVAYPEVSGGAAAGRMPVDDTCYVALLIDAPTRRAEQVSVADAARRATNMSMVESYDRPCLKGMPNTPS